MLARQVHAELKLVAALTKPLPKHPMLTIDPDARETGAR